MRVLLDTNIYLSYLLGANDESAIRKVVEAGVQGKFIFLLPDALWDELIAVIKRKPYFHQRITVEQVALLRDILHPFSEKMREIAVPIPRVVRDVKDDYLLAHALLDNADYLVTGDADLLTLDPVGKLRIISPRAFATLLETIEG